MQKSAESLKVCRDLPRRVLARVVAVQGSSQVNPFVNVTGGGGNARDLTNPTENDSM